MPSLSAYNAICIDAYFRKSGVDNALLAVNTSAPDKPLSVLYDVSRLIALTPELSLSTVCAIILFIVRIIRLSVLTVIDFSTALYNILIKAFNSLAELKLSLTCFSVKESGISKVTLELKNFADTLGL